MFQAHVERYPVAWMCRLLDVTHSKYYAWKQRGGESKGDAEDRRLGVLIRSIHAEWGSDFGYHRLRDVLRDDYGEMVGERRMRRLMQANSLWGIPAKKRRYRRKKPSDWSIPDVLQRCFCAAETNRIWVTDITMVATAEGKLHLCIMKDLCDGVVVAWRTSVHPNAELVTRTFDRAAQVRLEGVRPVVHSGRGSRYTSRAIASASKATACKSAWGKWHPVRTTCWHQTTPYFPSEK